MSSRALRKLQKEQELQKLQQRAEAAEEAQNADDSDTDEDEVPPAVSSKPTNAFDMLEEVDEPEDETEDGYLIPAKTSDSAQNTTTPSPQLAPQAKSKKKKKKSKKKAKPTETHVSTPGEESGDEVDRALKELSLKPRYQAEGGLDGTVTAQWEAIATKLLAVDSRNLNPMNEMRSLFGSAAIEESESRPSQRPQRRREVNQQGGVDLATGLTGRYCVASRGKELGVLAKRRNILMQGKEDWPLATSGGLSMEYKPDTSSFARRYNILHNQQYQQTQRDFRITVESMDPQRMIAMLSIAPYHILSLLQVSEIAKHQGDHSVSGDLLERALFTFGRSLHSSFPIATRDGKARLPFTKAANRELYLTIWKYIRNLEMRGTWKTAFEWAKLLLQFDTLSDPYGVTMMIDQLALRGWCHDQLLKLASDEGYGAAWQHLPNIQISLVLAYLRAKRPKEARQQLAIAITKYPYIISALASSLDISPVPKALWGKLPASDAEKLQTELYVTRAKDLWNTPETSALLVEVAETLDHYKSYTSNISPPPKLEISLEEARHIMLLEIPPLIALLPRKFTSRPSFSFDILPPPSSEEDFTLRAPSGATDNSGPSLIQNLISTLGGAAGSATGVANEAFGNLMAWLSTPAQDAANSNPEQAMQNLEQIFGQDISPEMLNQIIDLQLAEDDANRVTPEGLGMPGTWDDNEDGDSMPELEDIPTTDTRPTQPLTPPQHAARNPRAATIEDEDPGSDSDGTSEQLLGPRRPIGRAVLRHVDSDDDEDVDSDGIAPHPVAPTHTLFSAGPAMRFEPNRTTAARPRHPSESGGATAPLASQQQTTEEQLENDPQRLQRWLLTTGLTEVQGDSSKMTLYVRRLRMLRKQQQDWILQMVSQRGGEASGVVDRVRRAMES